MDRKVELYIESLWNISDKCRVKSSSSSLTRHCTIAVKGEVNGKFYSLIIILRKFDVPELIVRDFTECKDVVINIWDEE